MTRAEHLGWAKERALDYARRGDLPNAVGSMISDFMKHDELFTRGSEAVLRLGLLEIHNGREAVVRWINGFN